MQWNPGRLFSYSLLFFSFLLPMEGQTSVARPLSVADFGALCDGVNDDTPAFQHALAAAVQTTTPRGGQRRVHVPAGQCVISSQLVIPTAVYLQGENSRGTELVAGASFPPNTAMVRIGDGTDYAFSAGVRDLTINMNHIPGSMGVYSNNVQEQSGVQSVVVTAYIAKCIYFDGTNGSVSNSVIRDVECLQSSGAAAGVGIDIRNSSWKNLVENVSIVPAAGSPLGATALYVLDAMVVGRAIHIENHTNGIVLDHWAVADISGIDGENVTDMLHLNTTAWFRFGVTHRSQGTNIVHDLVDNITLTDGYISMYQKSGTSSLILTDTGGTITAYNANGSVNSHLSSTMF